LARGFAVIAGLVGLITAGELASRMPANGGVGTARGTVASLASAAHEGPHGLVREALATELGRAVSGLRAEPEEPTATTERSRRETSGLTRAQRLRGYNACMVPDPGFGNYTRWKNLSLGHVILPKTGGMADDGGYDVVLHFHGHEAVRHGFVEVADGTVLAAVDLGVGSGVYEDTFARKELFPEMLESLTNALKSHSGDPRAHVRHLALSSWSAGYGAIVKILHHHADAVDAVVLLDSLHAGYVKGPPHDMNALHGVHVGSIAPVLSFARRAATGEKLLWLTHSTVRPAGYAATGEVADFLLDALGLERAPAMGTTPLGIELVSEASHGGLSVKGYRGDDETAHCAHVELLGHVVRDVLEPRWHTPSMSPGTAPVTR
jgi:hypothetical protein